MRTAAQCAKPQITLQNPAECMSSNCSLAWSTYVVPSFIPSACINAHCGAVASSYILARGHGSISTVLAVVPQQSVTYD